MAEDSVSLVRRVVEVVVRYLEDGERAPLEEALEEVFSPAVVVMPSSALASGSAGPYRGQGGVLRWLEDIRGRWPMVRVERIELRPAGRDAVVVLGVAVLRSRDDSGPGYASETAGVWRVEEGRVVSVRAFDSRRRALEEAAAELPSTHGEP